MGSQSQTLGRQLPHAMSLGMAEWVPTLEGWRTWCLRHFKYTQTVSPDRGLRDFIQSSKGTKEILTNIAIIVISEVVVVVDPASCTHITYTVVRLLG